MKQFNVPLIYRSPLISAIKAKRRLTDRLKNDFDPTRLDFGELVILLSRHFGFCYGVENAIDISFRALDENPGKRIFLLSEMIHNPQVNQDLTDRGVRFIMDTEGRQLIPWSGLREGDTVIIPAFGTTLEIEAQLTGRGIIPLKYNTTCPFVERVWNKAEAIGAKGYSVIIHGKPGHEETRATFSHSRGLTPTIVVKDMEEARKLAAYITGRRPASLFQKEFAGLYSPGFDPGKDLRRIGVVNQTTMLAQETQAISDFFRGVMIDHYQLEESQIGERFADTRDTLCYATNDNQASVIGMLQKPANLALVVGGYNSSNTSHLVELCEQVLPTYFISSEERLLNAQTILHWDFHQKQERRTQGYLPERRPITLLLTSGASCPDALVEGVIRKLLSLFKLEEGMEAMIARYA